MVPGKKGDGGGGRRSVGGTLRSIGADYSNAAFYRTLLTAFIGDTCVPIFNIFLPLLAHALGADALELGLVGGINYSVFMFMPFVLGRLANKRKTRRFFIIGSFSILTCASILYSIIANPLALMFTRIFEGVAWSMLWPSIEVSLAQNPFRDPRTSLSTYNSVWSFAAALGPIIGSVLVFFGSIQLAFALTSVMLLCSLILNAIPLLFFGEKNSPGVEEKSAKSGTESHPSLSEDQVTATRAAGVPKFMYLVTTATGAATATIMFTFFPSYSSALSMSILVIGAITFGYGIARFFGYTIAARQSFRTKIFEPSHRKRSLFLFLGVCCFSSLLLFVPDRTGFVEFVAFGLVGSTYAIVMSIGQVGLIAEAPLNRMGHGSGMLESSIGAGAFVGPVLAGTISGGSLTALSHAFVVPAVSFVVLAMSLWIFTFVSKRK